MSARTRVAMIGAMLVATLGARAAHAQPEPRADLVGYRVKQGDTLGLIASEFYGDRARAPYLAAENRMQTPRPLRPGERLKVPVTREIVTSPGDTFQSLAGTLLGDPRRGYFLAETNAMSPDDNLAAGTPILVPFTVTHVAQGTEPLAAISATYYGDSKFTDVIRRYNNLDKIILDKGDAITIPSFNVRVHPSRMTPPDSEAKLRRDRKRDATRVAAMAIPAARHAWRIGDYGAVKRLLGDVDVAFVELQPAIEIGVLLGSAYVALGDEDDAVAAFKKIVDRKPSHTLRKVDHSPKVLAVWHKVDGAVE
jgi:LysM repeat protein